MKFIFVIIIIIKFFLLILYFLRVVLLLRILFNNLGEKNVKDILSFFL